MTRQIDARTLIGRLFGLLRAHPKERAAALPLAVACMDERWRRTTFCVGRWPLSWARAVRGRGA